MLYNNREVGTIFQVSIMNAMLEGVYDGETTIEEMAKHGDFGLGTFNGLDGELIAVRGQFYQIRNDGTSVLADPKSKVPFGAVTTFRPQITHEINNHLDRAGLEELMQKLTPSHNLFYAVYIEGHFDNVKTRTVSKQEKPYLPFTEVVKEQTEFDFNNENGLLAGFFSPAYAQGMTIAGFHLHFLTHSRQGGGHVLDFNLSKGILKIQALPYYTVLLPEQKDFEEADLAGDKSQAIIATEG